MAPTAPPAIGQFVSWNGGCLFIGRNNPLVPMHSHYAIQVAFGREWGIGFRTSAREPWTEYGGALIPSRQPHSMDPTRMTANAVMFVEPETPEGRVLDELYLAHGIAAMPEVAVKDAQALFAIWESGDPAALVDGCMRLIRTLTGNVQPRSPSDERILKATAYINANLGKKLSLGEVAAEVFLSPSRFRHLFIEETGMALRPYILWRRFLKVWALLMQGGSISEAAHEAGFADAAHLTRTSRRMFGITPTAMTMRRVLGS
jgi:AraC family transcriptional regulator